MSKARSIQSLILNELDYIRPGDTLYKLPPVRDAYLDFFKANKGCMLYTQEQKHAEVILEFIHLMAGQCVFDKREDIACEVCESIYSRSDESPGLSYIYVCGYHRDIIKECLNDNS